MQEQELKTSTKQRVWIGIIAIILVVSFIASYAAIIVANSSSSSSSTSSLSDEKMAQYENEYSEALTAFEEGTADEYAVFSQYLSEIKSYNETTANSDLTTEDFLEGTGRELTDGDTDYIAFYVGYCADESIFDSSLDSETDPTAFAYALNVSGLSLIEGWNTGVVGMKLGGVREVTIPSELAYGDTTEICGGTNKPIRFVIMAVEDSDELSSLLDDLTLAETKLQYANYGIDYDELMTSVSSDDSEEEATTEESTEDTSEE